MLTARSLGQDDKEKASRVAGNSQFLGLIIYIVFLLFGVFGVRFYIATQTNKPNDLRYGGQLPDEFAALYLLELRSLHL